MGQWRRSFLVSTFILTDIHFSKQKFTELVECLACLITSLPINSTLLLVHIYFFKSSPKCKQANDEFALFIDLSYAYIFLAFIIYMYT